MRLPLISGLTVDENAEFATSYPVNLETVAVDNKIATAQFRATSGALPFATGPGVDRGGILWNEVMYRVMGTSLVSVSATGAVTTIGDVGGSGRASLDYSFDRLAIRSGDALWYWNGSALSKVTDPDLGTVKDMLWIDGYFMTTDGEYVVVTELNAPDSVKPLKYGSAEDDPDPITGLFKLRDEPYVLNRHTIQVFKNVGGNGFPFATIRGATIPVGCVGPNAKCHFADSFAFVGSARNEALGVYIAGNGSAARISTRTIDDELAKVADPSTIVLESRTSRAERRLFVHLPEKTLVYLFNASRELQEPCWYVAQSGHGKPYRLRNSVTAYGKVFVGDTETAAIGELTDRVCNHFGEIAEWGFDVGWVYNEARGGIIHKLELVGLPGHVPTGDPGSVFLSMTRDGRVFSEERAVTMGRRGETTRRLQWRPRVNFRNWIGFRFRGYGGAMPGFAALEAEITPLNA